MIDAESWMDTGTLDGGLVFGEWSRFGPAEVDRLYLPGMEDGYELVMAEKDK